MYTGVKSEYQDFVGISRLDNVEGYCRWKLSSGNLIYTFIVIRPN